MGLPAEGPSPETLDFEYLSELELWLPSLLKAKEHPHPKTEIESLIPKGIETLMGKFQYRHLGGAKKRSTPITPASKIF